MPFVIAVTGSIASGKSSAIRFFAKKGIPIVSADDINRTLLEPTTPTFTKIVDHFGSKIINERGQLNKQVLRNVIFSNAKEKQWLESLLHPIIREKMLQQVNQSVGPYVAVEIPLLKSKQDYPFINRILLLDIDDKETQIKRIIERDHCGYKEAEAAIKNHTPFSAKRRLADDVIHNNGSKDELLKKLNTLHEYYRFLANLKT